MQQPWDDPPFLLTNTQTVCPHSGMVSQRLQHPRKTKRLQKPQPKTDVKSEPSSLC